MFLRRGLSRSAFVGVAIAAVALFAFLRVLPPLVFSGGSARLGVGGGLLRLPRLLSWLVPLFRASVFVGSPVVLFSSLSSSGVLAVSVLVVASSRRRCLLPVFVVPVLLAASLCRSVPLRFGVPVGVEAFFFPPSSWRGLYAAVGGGLAAGRLFGLFLGYATRYALRADTQKVRDVFREGARHQQMNKKR